MSRRTHPEFLATVAALLMLLGTHPVHAQTCETDPHDVGAQSVFTFLAPFTPQPLLDRPNTSADCLNFILGMAAGGAVGDFDNDGDQDIFFLSGGVEPDRLYINDGTGVFTDQAVACGVDATHIGIGVAVGDVNN